MINLLFGLLLSSGFIYAGIKDDNMLDKAWYFCLVVTLLSLTLPMNGRDYGNPDENDHPILEISRMLAFVIAFPAALVLMYLGAGRP